MTDFAEDRRRGLGTPRGRALALAVALVAHAVLLTALLWRFETWPAEYATPTMEVVFVPPPLARTPRPARSPATIADRAPRPPPELHVPAAPIPSPIVPLPAPLSPPSDAPEVRQALRGLVGCDHAGFLGLSDAERERCRDRLARTRGGDARSAQIELDLARRAAAAKGPEKEGFLARTPHNGCVPRVKEKEMGEQVARADLGRQDWTTGIACAWSF